ncbi:MAG: DNA primase DnaG [Candidatus Methylarchaceae archaeon HK01B]|nr:DNA primase DnaG [Candidatus Methylarchaceae archaeon HK01M]MCP8312107.1 DNA primase DnaG [Candidatus Methylarchaceae archaeon HK02M1]MCP8318992.1 DNA primase DnaG [Candidatus Methylarchaceae archaeon HK01B]
MHSSIVKYHVRLKFDIEGVVEKADMIGAIFGQTEGLFGPEMNLNELQKSWKVGRIEVSLESKRDRTYGEVLIPMSTDVSTAALIAAAVESVDKVGPCSAHFTLLGIEDVRVYKRKVIVERAKEIIKEWASKSVSESGELLKDLVEVAKRSKLISYGKEGLPAGPSVYTSDIIIVVEGRADVINLLKAGIDNVIAIEGVKIPESVIKLSKEKRVVAFLDGDRGGDLISKELSQITNINKIIRAPQGKEVEDLAPTEIISILKREMEAPPIEEVTVPYQEQLIEKVRELFPEINNTLEAIILDENFSQIMKVPINELMQSLENVGGAKYLVFDGIITQRLIDSASKIGINAIVGHRVGDITKNQAETLLKTFDEFGLE